MSLSVSRLVRVAVNFTPQAAAVRSFGTLCIAGDSDVINGLERLETFTTYDEVAVRFGVDAPESKAAAVYFGQRPKPSTVIIGRWIRVATAGLNIGGILTASEQTLATWTAISAGSLDIDIDGDTFSLTGLDFTGVTNLNGVATIITAALSGAATVTWNGENFVVTSATTGAGAKATGTITLNTNPSYGAQAHGTITLSGQPSNGDTVTIKTTVVTFVTGTPSGNQVQIGATDADTIANLQAFLEASADTNLAAMTYNTIGLITTITARVYGTAGNAYALTKSGANIAVSGADLAGGVAPDTLTIDGYLLTFVAANAGSHQVLVGPTVAATAANLQTYLNTHVDGNLPLATYATVGTVTTVTAASAGTAGNSFTLAKSSSHISVSGATLSGGLEPSEVSYATTEGSGTDISALLKLTASTAQALVTGYDAETPAQCAAVLANKSAAWYGLMFQASVQPTDDQNIDVCTFIEALDLTRVFGVTITNTNVLSALVTSDLASRMADGGFLQSFNQYSSKSAYAVASFFGRGFTVDFTADNTTINLMFKQEPGVAPEELTETEALVLKAKRCNVFVKYVNDTSIIQYGVMSGSAYFDEIHGTDWLQNAVQTAVYNVLYTSGKVPQTDAGINKLINAIDGVLGQAVANGLVAPGVWNADGFGELETGQYLKTGYYIFAESVDLQSQSDREARKSPPSQVAVKLAGAVDSVDILIDVNR